VRLNGRGRQRKILYITITGLPVKPKARKYHFLYIFPQTQQTMNITAGGNLSTKVCAESVNAPIVYFLSRSMPKKTCNQIRQPFSRIVQGN